MENVNLTLSLENRIKQNKNKSAPEEGQLAHRITRAAQNVCFIIIAQTLRVSVIECYKTIF